MQVPLWSIVTLLTELFVTGSVFYIVLRAYRSGIFLKRFAAIVLGYELLFNVSYMASREVSGAEASSLDPYVTALAIFHGIFSLVMFLALVAFFITAWRAYGRGENFFAKRSVLTVTFISAWTLSILSGITLFAQLYLF